MHFLYQLLSFEVAVLEIGNAVPELAFGRTTAFNTQFSIEIWETLIHVGVDFALA